MKGNEVVRDEHFFLLSETAKESCAGVAIYPVGFRHIFKKKLAFIEIKKFEIATGNFITVIK